MFCIDIDSYAFSARAFQYFRGLPISDGPYILFGKLSSQNQLNTHDKYIEN